MLIGVGEQDICFDRGKQRLEAVDQFGEVGFEEEDAAARMVDREGDLLVAEAGVGSVEDRADTGDGIEEFEMPVRVPGQRRNTVAAFDSQFRQRLRRLPRAPFAARPVIAPQRFADELRDNLPPAMRACGVGQDRTDLQGGILHQAG